MKALAACALLFLAAFPACPVPAEAPLPGQDWEVTVDTSVSDRIIYMGLNDLRVLAGATLELRNVTLRFNHTDTTGGIFVDQGAVLRMAGCAINDLSRYVYPCFVVQGTAELTDCAVNHIGSWNWSGGLEVEGGQVTLTRCRFDYMPNYCIVSYQSTVTAESSDFVSSDYGAVRATSGSALDMRNCTLRGYYYGVSAYYSEVSLYRCAFDSYYRCADFDECSVTAVGCSFESNGGPAPPLPPCDLSALKAEEADVAVVGCDFSRSYEACYLTSYSDSDYYVGARLADCSRSVLLNCSFNRFSNYAVMVTEGNSVEIRDCSFYNNTQGVYSYGYTADTCAVRGCRFTSDSWESSALYAYSGGARFENNTVELQPNSYQSPVRCTGTSEILNNTIVSGGRSQYPGIWMQSWGYGDRLEVSGNLIDGWSDGIYVYSYYGQLLARNNTIRNCQNGVNISGNAELRGNRIDADLNGIRLMGLSPSDWPGRITVADNEVDSGLECVRVMASSELDISNNRLRSGTTGIRLAKGPAQIGTVVISRNQIEANRTGIDLDSVAVSSPRSAIANNTIASAEYGMALNRTGIAVRDNSMDNITGCGVLARDCTGNLSLPVSSFTGERSSGAMRETRIWSVVLDVRYNINPPGDPQLLRPCRDYELAVSDLRGPVHAEFDRANQSLELVGYHVLANGSRFEYNPYFLEATSAGKGASRTSVWVTEPSTLMLCLFKGPDLVAGSLTFSNRLPAEGELLYLCATAQNDGRFNPDGADAQNPLLRLLVDGEMLAELELPVFPNGTVQPLSAAWIATPGWHNATFQVDMWNEVTEVFEDNNILTVPFYVMPLPAGGLAANDTEPVAGTPVGFSIDVEGDAAGYRFDFGDGEDSGWLTVPAASHVYLRPGDYIVRGYLVTAMGMTVECRGPLLVAVGAFPSGTSLRAYPDPARTGRPVLFTMAFTGWGLNLSHQIWYFGDGGYAYSTELAQAEHIFQRPGNYTVECLLGFEDGSSRTYRLALSVGNAPPVASGAVSPARGTAATEFSFTSDSRDPDGNILACVWDFGDGRTSSAPFSTHSFGRHGIFTVNLTVQDNLGQWSAPRSFPVTVENTPPAVRLGPVRGEAVPGSKLLFDGSGTADIDDPPGALSYSWDFGDGSSAAGAKATHAYKRTGRFTVTLTVDDGAGGISTKTAAVEVRQGTDVGTGWQIAAGFALVLAFLVVTSILLLRLRKKGKDQAGAGATPAAGRGRASNGQKPLNNVKSPGNPRAR